MHSSHLWVPEKRSDTEGWTEYAQDAAARWWYRQRYPCTFGYRRVLSTTRWTGPLPSDFKLPRDHEIDTGRRAQIPQREIA